MDVLQSGHVLIKLLNLQRKEKLFGFWGRNAIYIQGEENQADYILCNIQCEKTTEQLSAATKLSPWNAEPNKTVVKYKGHRRHSLKMSRNIDTMSTS